MMYQFEYRLSEKDVIALHNFHARKSRWIFSLICLFISFFQFLNGNFFGALFSVVLSACTLFGYGHLLVFATKIALRARKKQGKLFSGKDCIIRFYEDSFTDITGDDEMVINLKYTEITQIAVRNHAIYIFFSGPQAFILNFSLFESEEQKNEFLIFINSKVNTA